jgi:hypothetical protein
MEGKKMKKTITTTIAAAAIAFVAFAGAATAVDQSEGKMESTESVTTEKAVTVTDEVKVDRIMTATGMVDHEPEGVASEFPSDVGQVNCFTHVMGMDNGSVTHKWIYKKKVMAEVQLKVGGSSWRTWSRKTIDPIWSGDWKVEVVDDSDGTILKTIEFVVSE